MTSASSTHHLDAHPPGMLFHAQPHPFFASLKTDGDVPLAGHSVLTPRLLQRAPLSCSPRGGEGRERSDPRQRN